MLSTLPCPDHPCSHTRCAGATESSTARVARGSSNTRPPTDVVSQPPGGVRRAAEAMESRRAESAGSGVGEESTTTSTPVTDASPTCACASSNPGTTVRPPSGRCRVKGPASPAICCVVPTATMRSPRIATACTHGRAESAVKTLPSSSTRSGAALPAADCALSSHATSGRTSPATSHACVRVGTTPYHLVFRPVRPNANVQRSRREKSSDTGDLARE